MISIIGKQMIFPNEEQTFILGDGESTSRTFILNRYEADRVDLSGLTFRLDVEYKGGQKDSLLLVKAVQEKQILLQWDIRQDDLRENGTVFVALRGFDADGVVRWTGAKTPIFVENVIDTPGSWDGKLTELEQMEREVSIVLDSEKDRVAAEEARAEAETKRTEAETKRAEAEEAREAAETERTEGESRRAEAETARGNAEEARVEAETNRTEAESGRKTAESGRVSAEKNRADAEAGRNTAETARADSEEARKQEEAKRAAAEQNRAEAETDRKTAETQRETKEESRGTAEGLRNAAEYDRRQNENTRSQNENIRTQNETGRINAENIRRAEEQKREDAELGRAASETNRAAAEEGRISAENSRIYAENDRNTAETARVNAEGERQAAENARAFKEAERIEAERRRDDAERVRDNAEKDRAAAENAKAEAEESRVLAEADRVKEEEKRQAAEQERENFFGSVEGQISDLKADLDDIDNVVGIPKFEWVLGKINSDGTTYDIYKNYVRSENYVDFTNITSMKISIPDGFQAQLFWYSSDKSSVQSEYKVKGVNTVTSKDEKPLMRLQLIKLNHSGSADMSWLDGFEFKWFDLLKSTDIDNTLSVTGKVADSKTVGDRFDKIDKRMETTESILGIANVEWTTGLINASDGTYTTPYSQRLLSQFVEFNSYDAIEVTIPTGFQILVGWYDSDGNPITTEKSTEYKVAGSCNISLKTGSSKVLFNIINLSSTSADMSWLDGFEFKWGTVLFDSEIEKMISDSISKSNVLYGKKYVACGDSFTEGDFSGWTDEEGKTGTSSTYIYDKDLKMYKTYPYWIAKRNGMTLINEAKCGSTMALSRNYIDGTEDISVRKPFSYQRYKDIPSDADYITLWFGLNDINASNLGNITDTTNETFYGAWNVVLEYLITNHPYAKIGIIVTDAYDTYNDAVRAISEKWGIPMLDLMGDKNVPLMMGRKDGINLDSRANTLRRNAFMVSSSNFHPNLEAHKYQSTFIENFLRSL